MECKWAKSCNCAGTNKWLTKAVVVGRLEYINNAPCTTEAKLCTHIILNSYILGYGHCKGKL